MPKTPFAKEYARLNARQREAVDAIEGPVMVVAGPGTGKTQILALRVANILRRTDTPPEAVLALTFTEKATANMRERLVSLIGQDGWRVKVRTFHSFCNEVIHADPDAFPHITGGFPLGEADRLAIVETLLGDLDLPLLRPVGRPELYVTEIGAALDTLKREGIFPEAFAGMAAQEAKAAEDETQRRHAARHAQLARLYAAYERHLQRDARYDYADMLVEVDRALKADTILLRGLQERYLYILVDEHQDTNGLQNAIVNRIAAFHESPNLFVVGDLQQAIYRFQGASLANFSDFERRWKSTRVIVLTDNYRSTLAILRAAGAVMPGRAKLVPKAGHTEQPVIRYAFSSPAVQEHAIAGMIAARIRDGVRPGDIAVLARTNAELVPFADILERRGIPSQSGGDDQVLSDPNIAKLLAVARAVLHVGETRELLTALTVDLLGVDPLDSWTVADASERGKINAWRIMKDPKMLRKLKFVDRSAVERAAQLLTELASAVRNQPAPQALQSIVDGTGLLPRCAGTPDGERTIARLHTLYDLVRDQLATEPSFKLAGLLESLERLERHDVALQAAPTAPQDAVQLLTVHKAKGLEFDTVFVPNATAQNWESKRVRSGLNLPAVVWAVDDALGDDAAEDARRVIYVALTRAKRRAVLCWPKARADGKPTEPSRFLLAIPDDVATTGDAARWETDFLKGGQVRLTSRPAPKERSRRERIRELFNSRPLSVSALNNFLQCPWKYFFQNLLRFPGISTPASEYGKAAHAALELTFRDWARDIRVNARTLTANFARVVRRAPLNAAMRAQIEREGTADLRGWYESSRPSWRKPLVAELDLEVTAPDGRVLTGKLDKVEFLSGSPSGGPARVVVVDYKTRVPMSENAIRGRTSGDSGNEFRQLCFYRLLLDNYRGGQWRMAEGRIDFLKPAPSGRYRSVALTVGDDDVASLEAAIADMARQVRGLKFWDARCGDRDCEFCKMRDLMH